MEGTDNRFYRTILVKSHHNPNLLLVYQYIPSHLKTQHLIKYKIKYSLYSLPQNSFPMKIAYITMVIMSMTFHLFSLCHRKQALLPVLSETMWQSFVGQGVCRETLQLLAPNTWHRPHHRESIHMLK